MAVHASQLFRAFEVSSDNGTCPLCRGDLVIGEQAYFATGRKGPDGSPLYTPEAQVAPRDSRVETRPTGCTCRGRRAHTTRCRLHQTCDCPTVRRRGRGGRSYQQARHGRDCPNKIGWNDLYQTLPGCWDRVVHVGCAQAVGLVVPENSKQTRGSRWQGRYDTSETPQEVATVAPTPTVASPSQVPPRPSEACTVMWYTRPSPNGLRSAR